MKRVGGPLRTLATVALLSLVAGIGAGARADGSGTLTHLAMLRETAREAIVEMLDGAPLRPSDAVVVRPGRAHAANWIVSDLLAAELAKSGYRVTVEEIAPPVAASEATPTESTEAADADTTSSLLQQIQAAQAAEEAAAEASTPSGDWRTVPASDLPVDGHLMEFRVGDFGVHYVGEGRPFFLGPKRVERATSVDLSCRLIDGRTDDVKWVGEGDAVRIDRIAKSKLPIYETAGFTPTPLPNRGSFRYVEPVVVGGIVAGLVYLFYTNQN